MASNRPPESDNSDNNDDLLQYWFCCCLLNLSTSSHTIRSPGVGFMPDILDVKAGEISHGDDPKKIKKKERVRVASALRKVLMTGGRWLFVVEVVGKPDLELGFGVSMLSSSSS
ncbi:hypothetical protein L1987_08652 [Smallanthus sonchifolius]|uniref:Uncharacterized protein n=1 Tax=Smallanthus sonchifolius TaxID=185202 RepID=A0ACB9JMW7_9ASTR|nr:hypothetical protein L1987_08652 [Smallanthus sonchifolius]